MTITPTYIIAQILCITSVTLGIVSYIQKTKKNLVLYQILLVACDIGYSLLMQNYTTAICDMSALVRNLYLTRPNPSKIVLYGILLVGITTGIIFNTRGWLGVLTIVATIEFSLTLIHLKDVKKIKICAVINLVLWCIYNSVLGYWLYAIFNVISIIVLIVEIAKLDKHSNEEEAQINNSKSKS